MHFVVHGCWDHGSAAADDTEVRFARAFRPTDESWCAWVDPENQHLLRVTFDVEAANFHEAIEAGRSELVAGAHLVSLGVGVTEVVAMTDEGYRTWSA